MKALTIAAVLLFAAAPAYAQGRVSATRKKTPKKDPAREKQEDEAYKSSLQANSAQGAASSDPWGSRAQRQRIAAKQAKDPGQARPDSACLLASARIKRVDGDVRRTIGNRQPSLITRKA